MTKSLSLTTQTYSQYHIVASIQDTLCIILIDTGSCVSYISSDMIRYADVVSDLDNNILVETFPGETLSFDRQAEILLTLKKGFDLRIEIPVDPRPIKEEKTVLLGMDFLDQFQYRLTNDNLELIIDGHSINLPRFNLYFKKIQDFLTSF